MKNLAIILFLITAPIITSAESNGIEATNYSVSIATANSDAGNTFSVLGTIRSPLMNNIGISVNAGLSEFNGKNNYIDSSGEFIGLDVFIREYNLGLIELGYNYRKSDYDFSSGTLNNSSDTFSLLGIYYIHNFDLSLLRSTMESITGNKNNISDIGVSYYITDNLRAGISFGGMDLDNSNAISIQYQPKIFNNSIAISASYRNSDSIDSYGLSLSYYFDTKVSLIDRARKY